MLFRHPVPIDTFVRLLRPGKERKALCKWLGARNGPSCEKIGSFAGPPERLGARSVYPHEIEIKWYKIVHTSKQFSHHGFNRGLHGRKQGNAASDWPRGGVI